MCNGFQRNKKKIKSGNSLLVYRSDASSFLSCNYVQDKLGGGAVVRFTTTPTLCQPRKDSAHGIQNDVQHLRPRGLTPSWGLNNKDRIGTQSFHQGMNRGVYRGKNKW